MKDKKQISVYKFDRMKRDPRSIRVRGLIQSHRGSVSTPFSFAHITEAIDAYKLGEHIYMWIRSDKSAGDRLTLFFVRYKLDSPKANADCVACGGRLQKIC